MLYGTHARRRGLAPQLIDDSATWAGALGTRRLNITVALKGLDASHQLRYYTARGFHDEGRSIITLPSEHAGIPLRPIVAT